MFKRYTTYTALALSALLSACSWVKPIPQSYPVALLEPADIVNCVKKGVTHSKTLSKFLFVPRMDSKIEMELVTLAKNEAAIMNGDSIVAEGPIESGARTYGVYQCRNQ